MVNEKKTYIIIDENEKHFIFLERVKHKNVNCPAELREYKAINRVDSPVGNIQEWINWAIKDNLNIAIQTIGKDILDLNEIEKDLEGVKDVE